MVINAAMQEEKDRIWIRIERVHLGYGGRTSASIIVAERKGGHVGWVIEMPTSSSGEPRTVGNLP